MPKEIVVEKYDRAIFIWLVLLCLLIFSMILLGGATRLTHSGLSMVEWHPVLGILPPINESDWLEEFTKYQQFPEYQKINFGISLQEFKRIYLFEYSHRVLCRFLAVAFVLPFAYFLIRRAIFRKFACKLLVIPILGIFQGVLGWYMVKSGLVDRPDVSPHRLAAHLGLAVIIYGYTFLLAVSVYRSRKHVNSFVPPPKIIVVFTSGAVVMVFLTILAGAFVAGNDAGLAFNTFPLMDGQLIPSNIFSLQPWWHNIFENVALVQLIHRLLALVTCILVIGLWLSTLKFSFSSRVRFSFFFCVVLLLLQFLLGIMTLTLFVPISLGIAHQAGAILVFSSMLWCWRELIIQSKRKILGD